MERSDRERVETMRKRTKRGISSLLCVAMVLGMLVPVGALAEEETLPVPDQLETGWNGTETPDTPDTPETPAETEEAQPEETPTEPGEALPEETPAQSEEPDPAETPAQPEEPDPAETPAATEEPEPTESPAQTEEPQPEESPAQTEEPQPEESLEPDEELLEEDPFAALLSLRAATDEYEIYPTPHSIRYVEGDSNAIVLPATLNVVYEDGIDQYTKDRAEAAFDQVGVTLSEDGGDGTLKLRVGVKNSGGLVDTYFASHPAEVTGLYDKYDAYQLIINADGVAVLGKDTDAAFYGLTTVKEILVQVEPSDPTVRMLTVEDYADVEFRGFIEGYYGNPWTVEDRAALMEFGGEIKMNIYFYAPKDDPKHSSKWRELYTQEELETKIRPLAEAGNRSKCYYGYALHPFWAEGINYSDDAVYAQDLNVLKAKFEQAMSVGVRQIAVLADDRGLPGVGVMRSYVRLMTDLTNWVSSPEMQAKYPGLKTSIPFCPNDYMGNGSSEQIKTLTANLPASVPVIMTGGTIWGQVSHSFLNTYRQNTNSGTFMWVNWPCSDKSKGSLTMGAHDIVLHNDLTQEDISTLRGIMLNPMQQSEPSKAAIFQNADYAWNIWNGADHQERKDNVWNDCFKYVDHNNGIETPESAALRELSKHMIHQNGSVGWHEDYPESKELKPLLSQFLEKLSAGTLTVNDIDALRPEFETLHDAAVLYKAKTTGNTRILGQRKDGGYVDAQEQMAPWLDYWEEFSQANLDLLDALRLILENSDGSADSEIVTKYLLGQGQLAAAQSHKFLYMDHDEYAIAGGMHIVPFTNKLMAEVSEKAKTIIDPTVLIETIITNRSDTPAGGLQAMRDGDPATEAVFKNPNSIAVGTYVGVQYNRPISIESVRFEVGTAGNANDTFNDSKLQYMDENGQWTDISGAAFTHGDLVLEAEGLALTAKGVRAIATSERTGTWFGVKEIYINGKSGPIEGEETAEFGKLNGTVIKSSRWEVYEGPESNLLDGDDNTVVWYKETGTDKDVSLVGDYIGLDLGKVKSVGRVRFVVGGGNGDKWTGFKLQYSTDNSTWTDVKTYTGVAQGRDVVEEELGGVEARYVRLVNTVQVNKWVKFSEISVWADATSAILYQSEVVKKLVSPLGELAEDKAALSADNVALRPGEFVGIALPRIRQIVDIVADYTAAPGVVLELGMSESEMEEVRLNGRTPYSGYARYIRLRNAGSTVVAFRLNELSVESEEILGVRVESATIGGAGNGEDARKKGNIGNWFDGNVETTAKLCAAQVAGQDVVIDLGQKREVKNLRLVVRDTQMDYPRQAKVQISMDAAGPWTDVITVNTPGDADTSAVNAGWLDVPGYPNYMGQYGELPQAQEARYLRIVYTGDFGDRWLELNEIIINDGEYVRTSNDPTFETDPIEIRGNGPDRLVDGDYTTGFQPDMAGKTSGYLSYRLSDNTNIGQINVIQNAANISNATVSIRTGKDEWHELDAKLTQGLTRLDIPEEYENVFEIKLSWGNVTPTFYEFITIPREKAEESGGGQAPSTPETVPVNNYSGSDCTILFDENWKFNYGDANGAQEKIYNDGAWRTIDLPHDYSIELDYTSAGEAESGYLLGGVGWYRKSFTVSPYWEDKVVTIDFGGVYMDSEVYLNGTKLGEHHYGYTPFSFVLPSDLLDYSGENVIAVRCDNPVPSSRWYSGSGIYRSVHLTVSDPVHVARYGTKVETTNGGSVTVKTNVENSGSAAASVTVKQEIFKLNGTTFEKEGAAVATDTSSATNVSGKGTGTVTQSLTVSSPALWNSWDQGTPNLYVLVTSVMVGSQVVDTYETEFGFREINFDVNVGFQLNGKNVKLKGVCQHHDQGALGSEAWYRALERQVEILMDMGVNSIRVTHNPAADELIEICNRKGMLLIDEIFDGWARPKNGNSGDFSRWFNRTLGAGNALVGGESSMKWQQFVTETVINRDKNAPCMIMYSICNEVQEGSGTDGNYATYAREIIGWIQAIDRTRPVTRGDNSRTTGSTGEQGEINQAIHNAGGVVGFNYFGEGALTTGHNNGWRMYGSETASHVNSRGIYNIKGSQALNSKKRLTSYDKSAVGWGATASDAWWRTIRYDYNAGEYIWTGFDYIGEPTPNNGTGSGWANGADSPKNSFFGAIDTNGLPKDNYWLYRSMWNDKYHTLHILPTWDREDLVLDSSGRVEVVVYTDAPMVKLYLNDTEVGTATSTTTTTPAGHIYRTFTGGTGTFVQKSGHQSLYATFNVTYAAGTLRAEACDESGNPLSWITQGRGEVKTTSGASKLVVTADRLEIKNDGRDLSYITIDVTDQSGEIVNGAEPSIKVSVSGDGRLMGLDNGVQPDHTSYLSDTRKAGAGQLVAIVQSTKTEGAFTVTATSDGLSSGSVTVQTSGVDHSTGGDVPVSYDISKTIYVQLNTAPSLPDTLTLTLGNGSKETKAVTWGSYDPALLGTVGSQFSITGTIADYGISVSIGIVVLDEVAALLNYSTAVRVGEEPILPSSRPAVMADGTVVTAQFPVSWDVPEASAYNKAGTVTVTGTAEAFGKEYTVTAVVRVTKGEVAEGGNVMNAVSVQPNGFTIDGVDNAENRAVLDGLRDGDTAVAAWTGNGSMQLRYDTQQNFYRIKLTYAGAAPASGVSLTLENGPVTVRPQVSGNTAVYELGDIHASEFVTVAIDGDAALSEVELITGTPVFVVGSTAELDDVKVNGESASAEQLAAKLIKTTALMGVVNPVSRFNVACTILPENNDSQIIIVTEAEDHNSRAVYTVQLDAPEEIEPDDDSRDYPYTKTTATAPSNYNGSGDEGPASNAVDGNANTYWHSNWAADSSDNPNDLTQKPDKRYIQLNLQENAELIALRYKPRPTVANGIVTKYRVEVSTDGTTYTTVAEGDWAHDTAWKVAIFDSAVTAKYVRLYGVETRGGAGDTPNKFMSCAELRVVMAAEDKIDLSQAVITVEPKEFLWKNVEIRPGSGSEADQGTKVTVTLFGEELVRTVDYVLDYDNNVDPGTAYIYARALKDSDKYKGAAATTFTISKTDAKITSFEPMTVRAQAGVAPILPSTVWACMDDQHHLEVNVTWDAEPVGYPANYYIFPQAHEYILKGHIEEADLLSDPTLQPQLRVKMGWSESVDGVSLVTGVGVVPSLPGTVTVQFDDGTSGERTVSWNLDGVDFSAPGTVEVTGAVTGIDRVQAKASIRVAEGTENHTNIALNQNSGSNVFPMALGFVSAGNNNPYQAIKGNTGTSTDAGDRWSDWERNVYHTDPKAWMGVAFETTTANVGRGQNTVLTLKPHMVNRVKVMFVDENGNGAGAVTYPDDYEIQYYTGPVENLTFDTRMTTQSNSAIGNGMVRAWTGSPLKEDANWTTVSYIGGKPAVPGSNGQMLELEFAPVDTAIIRVLCTPKSGKWSGIAALEVYDMSVTANSTFTVSSVTLGGVEKLGEFDANKVLNIHLAEGEAIPKLAVTADNNARVSLVQSARVPGMPEAGAAWAAATVTSEDGSKTETYTVKFTREGAPEGYYIEVDAPDGEKDKITLTPNGGDVGTEITITVPEGYELSDAWVVIEDGDREGEHVHVENGKFIMPVGNVRFSARVTPIPYTITYDLDGGEVEGHNTTSYTVETPTFTLRNPRKTGYDFAGWTGTDITEPTMTVTIAQGSTGEREYRALWSENGTIVDPPEPPGPSGGSGGGSASNTTVKVDEKGNRIETTENLRTGKVTVTTTAPDGTVTTVVTTADGKQKATATLSKNSYGTVELAMPKLKPEAEAQIKVNAGSGKTLSVIIPIEGGDTVVAVRINKDGTETVVPLSVVDERGLRVKTDGTQTFKIIDNKKTFTDVPQSYWAAGAVDFVSSRELFNGMGSTETFVPEEAMNRAMLTTVLWRMAEKPGSSLKTVFADVQKGSWYEDAVRWGVETGVVKGTDYGFEPESPVTRETLAVMLYRAAGSPAVVDELPRRFTDNDQVSDWAQAGMIWAVQTGIINGRDGERLAPKDVASRAEVAAMLQRYVNTQV